MLEDEAQSFTPTPSLGTTAKVTTAAAAPAETTAIGNLIGTAGPLPTDLELDRGALEAAGFTAKANSTLVLPVGDGLVRMVVGLGDEEKPGAASLRDAAAAFARALPGHTRLALRLDGHAPTPDKVQALVEGVLLARYHYDVLRKEPEGKTLESLSLVTDETGAGAERADLDRAVARAGAFVAAQMLTRDLANTPHSHLTATRLGEIATQLSATHGFAVELFDKAALTEMGCGGLLGVNRGSSEPPLLIKLSYRPAQQAQRVAHIALVGKGIMYDSGGISLKPSDRVHAQMKNDMSGAAAVLSAIAELAALECAVAVTGFLMCTDNMPSGTAMALGDVITIRNGKTVEVEDTDAEGRLVLADGLSLAAEEKPDLIIDIATLTGSALRALGPWLAAVLGTDQKAIDLILAAGRRTGEELWQLPLHRPYRAKLASGVADINNVAPLGWPDAICASLFLSEFVADVPWAHIDICGTAYNDADHLWNTAGCSGFGARLLLETILSYSTVGAGRSEA